MRGVWRGKPDEGQSMKNLLIQWKLKKKPMPYNWGLKDRDGRARYETWKSKGKSSDEDRLEVTCSHVQLCVMRLGMSSVELPNFVQKHNKNQMQLSFFQLAC